MVLSVDLHKHFLKSKWSSFSTNCAKMPFPWTPSLWTKRQVLPEEPAGQGFELCLASMGVD